MDHLFSGRSVAIVGSSAALLERQQGAEIDAHDVVMRINLRGIHGRPECLGSRTDVQFFGFKMGRKKVSRYPEIKTVSAIISRTKNGWLAKGMPCPVYFTDMKMEEWLRDTRPDVMTGLNISKKLTSGTHGMAVALSGGAKCVTLFGFALKPEDWWPTMNPSGNAAVYGPQLLISHDPVNESILRSRLINAFSGRVQTR